ncbi:MAG: MBL fold metallo-hydrolase [Gemmatimonadales bacterium]
MPAHHHSNGGFTNPWIESVVPARLGGFLRWQLDRRLRPPLPDPDPDTFVRTPPRFAVPHAPADQLTITWVGHATFLIQIGELNLLTDPMWSQRASPLPWIGPKRWVAPGVSFDDLPAIDAVFLSHDHYDHLDDRSVCRLEARNPGARWFVPLGLGVFLRRRGVHDITELDWWQEATLGPLSVGCTPAQHFSGRTPWGRNRTLWCGWSVAAPGKRIFFAGDTGYHPEFASIAARFGPFDVVLLPIGAYEPRWFMQLVHMDPEEAVRAFQDVRRGSAEGRHSGADRPGRMVPMHWGTFKLTDEPLDEPPLRARAAWEQAGFPAEQFCLLAHGETLLL